MVIVLQENQDALLQSVMQDVGFSHDRPVAAIIIYKSLLQWRSFEAERTNVFDRIIQTVGTAIEVRDFRAAVRSACYLPTEECG